MELIKIAILIILIAVYNGLIINWRTNYQQKSEFWNKAWHSLGSLIRICIVFFFTDIKTGIAIILMQWIVYDALINLVRGKALFYEGSLSSGTGSTIDRLLSSELSIILKSLAFLTGLLILTL